jgi:hypothetical protein
MHPRQGKARALPDARKKGEKREAAPPDLPGILVTAADNMGTEIPVCVLF